VRQVVVKLALQTPRPRFREAYNAIAHASTRQEAEDANKAELTRHVDIKASGIYHGDFRDRYAAILPPASVQLVLTDPPYDEASVDLFGAAAEAASQVLRPGGSLLVYTGHKYIAECDHTGWATSGQLLGPQVVPMWSHAVVAFSHESFEKVAETGVFSHVFGKRGEIAKPQ
jgi:hypothetical protein